MVSGLDNLSDKEIQDLDKYFNVSLNTIKSTYQIPKIDLKTLNESIDKALQSKNEEINKLDNVLDVLEGLWMAQALKERHFDAWYAILTTNQKNEVCNMI